MKAYLHFDPRKAHQRAAIDALATGLHLHGVECHVNEWAFPIQQYDFAAGWGMRFPVEFGRSPRLVLEAGYINGSGDDYVENRLRFISAGWNGLHGEALDFPRDAPSDRWDALGLELEPWKTGPGEVLICEQVPGDACAPEPEEWRRIVAHTRVGAGVTVVRRHPLVQAGQPSLASQLWTARRMVTFASTAAVEAVIAGVPTVTYSPLSIARDVTAHAVQNADYCGPREQWAYNLAYRQWTLAEIEGGVMWDHMRHAAIRDDESQQPSDDRAARRTAR